jgi:hypothetical protein
VSNNKRRVVLELDEARPDTPGFVAFTEATEQGVAVVTYIASCNLDKCRWKYELDPVIANVGDVSAQASAVHVLRRHWQTMHPYARETWGPFV